MKDERKTKKQLIDELAELRRQLTTLQSADSATPQDSADRRDQTRKRAVQKTLRKSEEDYRSLFNSIRDAILVADTDRTIINCNPAFTSLFGFTLDELRGKKTLSLYKDEEEFKALGKELKKRMDDSNFFFSIDYRTKSGRVFPGETNVFYQKNADGKIVGFIGLIRDISESAQAERALRNAREYAENLIETANVMVVGLDTEGHITVFNHTAKQITGYTRHELEGKNWFEVLAPKEKYPYVWDEFDRLTKGGLPGSFENPILTKKGEERLIVWKNNVVRENGKIVGTISFGMDLTERVRVTESLRRSEYLLRQVLDTNPAVIFVKDFDSRVLLANKTMAGFYNLSVEDVTDQLQSDLHIQFGADQKDIDKWLSDDREVIDTGHPKHLVESGMDTQNRLHWFRTGKYPIEIEQGRRGVLVISEDITEQVQAENALRNSEQRYRSLFEHSSDAIFLHDFEGNIIDANQKTLALCGYQKGEFLKRTIMQLHPKSALEKSRQAFETIREAGAVNFEIDFKRKNGQVFPAEVSSTVIELGGEKVILGIVRDITERVQAEEALKRHAEEMAALHAITLDLTKPVEIQQILESIVARATDILNGSGGGVYLCEPDKRQVRCAVSYHTRRDYTGVVLPYGKGAAGQVAESGRPLVIDDYRTWEGRADVFEDERPFSAVLSVPIIWQGTVKGVLHVLREETGEKFARADLELLTMLANHAAIALENARLLGQAQRQAGELEERVSERTEELRKMVNSMAGREVRMAELKEVVKKLRAQLLAAGQQPVADDPLFSGGVQ